MWICPGAVAPPCDPIAGTTNGSAPSSRRASIVPRNISTRPVSPRDPPPTATVMPGVTADRKVFSAASWAARLDVGDRRRRGNVERVLVQLRNSQIVRKRKLDTDRKLLPRHPPTLEPSILEEPLTSVLIQQACTGIDAKSACTSQVPARATNQH